MDGISSSFTINLLSLLVCNHMTMCHLCVFTLLSTGVKVSRNFCITPFALSLVGIQNFWSLFIVSVCSACTAVFEIKNPAITTHYLTLFVKLVWLLPFSRNFRFSATGMVNKQTWLLKMTEYKWAYGFVFFPQGEFHADDKAEYANRRTHVCPEARYQSDA